MMKLTTKVRNFVCILACMMLTLMPVTASAYYSSMGVRRSHINITNDISPLSPGFPIWHSGNNQHFTNGTINYGISLGEIIFSILMLLMVSVGVIIMIGIAVKDLNLYKEENSSSTDKYSKDTKNNKH